MKNNLLTEDLKVIDLTVSYSDQIAIYHKDKNTFLNKTFYHIQFQSELEFLNFVKLKSMMKTNLFGKNRFAPILQ